MFDHFWSHVKFEYIISIYFMDFDYCSFWWSLIFSLRPHIWIRFCVMFLRSFGPSDVSLPDIFTFFGYVLKYFGGSDVKYQVFVCFFYNISFNLFIFCSGKMSNFRTWICFYVWNILFLNAILNYTVYVRDTVDSRMDRFLHRDSTTIAVIVSICRTFLALTKIRLNAWTWTHVWTLVYENIYVYQAPHANRNSAPKIGFKKIRVETSTWISFPVFKGEFLYQSGFGPRFFYIRVWAPKFSKRIFFHSEHARSRVIAQHMRRHPRRKTLEWCITQTNNKPKSILYTALPHHVFWCFGHCPHQLLCIIPMFPQRH